MRTETDTKKCSMAPAQGVVLCVGTPDAGSCRGGEGITHAGGVRSRGTRTAHAHSRTHQNFSRKQKPSRKDQKIENSPEHAASGPHTASSRLTAWIGINMISPLRTATLARLPTLAPSRKRYSIRPVRADAHRASHGRLQAQHLAHDLVEVRAARGGVCGDSAQA